jgi:hypothetical protein
MVLSHGLNPLSDLLQLLSELARNEGAEIVAAPDARTILTCMGKLLDNMFIMSQLTVLGIRLLGEGLEVWI